MACSTRRPIARSSSCAFRSVSTHDAPLISQGFLVVSPLRSKQGTGSRLAVERCKHALVSWSGSAAFRAGDALVRRRAAPPLG